MDPKSVAASRRFVEGALTDLPDELQEAAVLMVSELATNAIVHATTGFEVTIHRTKSKLRVEVADLGGGEPEVRMPPVSEPHGRGLQIVEELSDDWGITERTGDTGKTVWYEVNVDPPPLLVADGEPAQEATGGRAHQPSGQAPYRGPLTPMEASDRSEGGGPRPASNGHAGPAGAAGGRRRVSVPLPVGAMLDRLKLLVAVPQP